MGLPQPDFRVPEAAWFKSAVARMNAAMPWLSSLTSRFGSLPMAGSNGTLAWPYKIAVVTVMMIVASGTLVTFGMAGAETPSSEGTAALPGSDEASPTVEGQALPSTALSPGLFNPDDLLSTLNLTDFSPIDADDLTGTDEDGDEDSDDNSTSGRAAGTTGTTANPTTNPTSNPTTKPTTKPSDEPTKEPEPEPTKEPEPVEGSQHKAWVAKKAKYEGCLENAQKAGTEAVRKTQEGLCKVYSPGGEPSFTS